MYVWDFAGGPGVGTSPSNAGDVSLIPGLGANVPHASWSKNQIIKQKQYCNKLSEDLKETYCVCLPWISTGFTLPVESHTPDLCEMSPPSHQPQLRSPRADPRRLPQGPVFELRGSVSGRHTPSLSKQPLWVIQCCCDALSSMRFLFPLIILCISFWLCWVFVAATMQELLSFAVRGLSSRRLLLWSTSSREFWLQSLGQMAPRVLAQYWGTWA